jgi:hypothetical protein
VQLLLAQNATVEILEPAVKRLEDTHRLTQSSGFQDFETKSLIQGLLAMGKAERGKQAIKSYLDEHRRESGQPPPELLRLQEICQEAAV